MSFLTNKKTTFGIIRRKWFDKRVERYMITLKGGTIYYNGVQRVISYFPQAKFNDIEYIKILSHAKTSYEVLNLCWNIYVSSKKKSNVINITIVKRGE